MTYKTLGAYERHESPDYADGGVTAAQVEKEAEKPTADDFARADSARHPDGRTADRRYPVPGKQWCVWASTPGGSYHALTDAEMAAGGWSPVRECPDPDEHTLPGIARAVASVTLCSCSAQRARAEKAEQERDAWHEVARRATRRARRDAQLIPAYARLDLWVALGNDSTEFETIDPDWAELNAAVREAQAEALRAAESRPLTPDAVTDEMVERFRSALHPQQRLAGFLVEAGLRAALTEPPTRRLEAERLDPIIDAATRGHSDIASPTVVHAIADALAEEGVYVPEGER